MSRFLIFFRSLSRDHFTAYYGNNTDLGEQFRISGGSSGWEEDNFFSPFFSRYNEMLIAFTTDETISAKGFNISYRIGRLFSFSLMQFIQPLILIYLRI